MKCYLGLHYMYDTRLKGTQHILILINTDKAFDTMQIIYAFSVYARFKHVPSHTFYKASYEVIFNDKRIV